MSNETDDLFDYATILITILVIVLPFVIGGITYQTEPATYDYDYSGEDYGPDAGPGRLDSDYNSTHHVDPHWVDGYTRSDGTEVDGYWRGEDDGYYRSDPSY